MVVVLLFMAFQNDVKYFGILSHTSLRINDLDTNRQFVSGGSDKSVRQFVTKLLLTPLKKD